MPTGTRNSRSTTRKVTISAARARRQAAAEELLRVEAVTRRNNEAAWRTSVERTNVAIFGALKTGMTIPNVANVAGVSRQHVDKLVRDSGLTFPGVTRRA